MNALPQAVSPQNCSSTKLESDTAFIISPRGASKYGCFPILQSSHGGAAFSHILTERLISHIDPKVIQPGLVYADTEYTKKDENKMKPILVSILRPTGLLYHPTTSYLLGVCSAPATVPYLADSKVRTAGTINTPESLDLHN